MVDMYAYNYDNVPVWLSNISKNPVGKLIFPFKRYMYKYFSMVADHTLGVFDMNQPWQDRVSKLL